MECVVCRQPGSAYKCPACQERYCSVACCRQHKIECSPPSEAPLQQARVDHHAEKVDLDEQTLHLLRYASLRHHLHVVARILNDPAVSGEQTSEGRQLVALKKLRELRKGGREENELVEQFCAGLSQISSNAQ